VKPVWPSRNNRSFLVCWSLLPWAYRLFQSDQQYHSIWIFISLVCKLPESSVFLVLNWVNWSHLEMIAAPWLRGRHVIDLIHFHLYLRITRSSKLAIGRDHEGYEYHPVFCHNLLAESHCKFSQINTSPCEREVLLLIRSPYLLCVRLVVEFVCEK
jgi:hypothetical protein